MVAQIIWALFGALFLAVVAVGWAVKGAMAVHERMYSPRRRRIAVEPKLLRSLTEGRVLGGSVLLLALALYLLTRAMDRGLGVMGAVVLALAYAVVCAMVTGFIVWMRAQQGTDERPGRRVVSFRWAAWVGAGLGAVGVAYLVQDVVSNLVA